MRLSLKETEMMEKKSPPAALRSLILPLILLTASIAALTTGSIVHTVIQHRNKETARLETIADLKTRQIADWLKERNGDARFVQTSRFWIGLYRRWRDAGDTNSRDQLQMRLNEFREDRFFKGIKLLDEHGEPLWDSEGGPLSLDPALQAVAREVALSSRVIREGPYRDQAGGLHIDFFVPLPTVEGRPAPVIVLHTDPSDYLFSTLRTWPIPSASGETLLFQRDGDMVLFLSELRHKSDTAVKLRAPVSAKQLLSAKVLRGEAEEGKLVKGLDYRGIPIMGVVRSIPGTDWFLVAKLDRSELFAEATGDAFRIALTGILTFLIAATCAFFFRQRQALAASLRERRIQEEKLRALELLGAIAEGSKDAMFAKDLEGNYLLFNRESGRVTGKGTEEVLGRNDMDIFPPEEAEALMDIDRQVMTENRMLIREETLTTFMGERVFQTTKGPLHDPEGNVIGMFGISSDITERKSAEKALEESEERFRLAFENANVGMCLVDAEGRIVKANRQMCDIFGYSLAELERMTVDEITHPEYRDVGPISKVRGESGEADHSEFEKQYLHKQGHIVWGQVSSSLIRDDSGNPVYFISHVQDITFRKRAVMEKEKLQGQLLQAQKMESVGRLAGGVAHDFNNMLQAIIGHTEIALYQVRPDEPLYENLKEIKKAAERSADLTTQLLAFARKQTILPRALDLNDTVPGMLKMLQRLIGENIDLIWKPGADLWMVKMDPAQIDQILANLSVNARDAITGVGSLTIETENVVLDETYCANRAGFVPGEYVMLTVSDTGAGMDKDVLVHLFEPFFTTKELGKGTGLGLATIYGIVKQNKGFINIYSEPGQGTTVKIYLPPLKTEAAIATCSAEREPAGGNETILLVEDEASILELAKAILERYGYTVLATRSPAEAVSIAERYQGPIDLVVTDVVMPKMNGKHLKERIAAMRPGTLALYMSGYTSDIIAQQGIVEAGVHFMQKPFSVHTLATKVREVLDFEHRRPKAL